MSDQDCLKLYEDAEFYDLEFHDRNVDLDFYRRWALRADRDVLEIACGTGRITLPLARAGVPITALDVSLPMLNLAQQKAASDNLQIEWIHADCRKYALSQTFRLIFMAANALQHLHDLASLEMFFATARRHLDSDGLLILDVFNPNVVKLSRGQTPYRFKEFVVPGSNQLIRVEAASRYAAAEQVLYFQLCYSEERGPLKRSKHVAMRCFFPQELELLCKHVGLNIIQKFGGYDEQPFTSESAKQIIICQRAANSVTPCGPK